MKRILIAGMFVTGISIVIAVIGAFIAPDLLGEPGGFVALLAGVFVAVSGLFGGKISEWVGTIFGKREEKPQPSKINQQVNVKEMSGGVIAQHYHEAQKDLPKIHGTIGFIPPAKGETYIHRGRIEDEIIAHIRKGGRGAIVGVQAPGGLGKTELAKRTADKLSAEYEILWVDVGEKKPQQILGEMLIQCGVQTQPGDGYERLKAELQHAYQTHKFLVILDDVRKESLNQLGDFLPPSPCAALITSRIQQIGGVKPFALDAMTWEQAQELFSAVLGDEAVKTELETVQKLAERCKFNPLTMEIAARRIRQYTDEKKPAAKYFNIALAKFAELKADGDPRWDMDFIFDQSFEDLSANDQKNFLALSAFHPTGFALEAVAYIWACDLSSARQTLLRFVNLSLVRTVPSDYEQQERFRLHDLLDEYAAPKLKASANETAVRTALAEWLAGLFDEHFALNLKSYPFVLPERDNLLYACEWAREEKQADTLALLTTNARNWFMNLFRDAWTQWFAWLEACLRMGLADDRLKANVRKAIGDVQQFRDDRDAALVSYNEALKLFKEIGAKLGEANVLMSLGDASLAGESWNGAIKYYEQALPIYQTIQAQLGQANTLIDLGKAYFEIGEQEKGMEFVKNAGDLFAKIGSGYWAIKSYRRLVGMLRQCNRGEQADEIEEQLTQIEKKN